MLSKGSLLQVIFYFCHRFVPGVIAGGALYLGALQAVAQVTNNNFSVAVNTGPVAPNSDTVYPGQETSLRITLTNSSTVNPISNVNFSKALPDNGTGGLRVSGVATISGDPGCVGGTLTTAVGAGDIELVGLTIPVHDAGVPGSGQCFLDIPIEAYSDGASASFSYTLGAGEVDSDSGDNVTGGSQAYTVLSASRPTWSKGFPAGNGLAILGGSPTTLRIQVNNPDENVSLTNFSFEDVFPTSGVNGAVIEPTGTPATGTCVAPPVNAAVTLSTGAAAGVAVSGGTLAPSSSCTIEVEVRARHTNGSYQLTATNSIPASGFSSDEGLAPASNGEPQYCGSLSHCRDQGVCGKPGCQRCSEHLYDYA